MDKPESRFGWKIVLKNYGYKGILLDSSLPIFISFVLCVIMYWKHADILLQLKVLVGVGISIVPSMVALVLAAYTILLTFFFSDKFDSIKNTDNGNKLIQDLNSSFAACLFVSTISIIVMITISSIANMDIEICKPNVVNYPAYFFVCYLLVYSVSILLGIIEDLFNCGQIITLEK